MKCITFSKFWNYCGVSCCSSRDLWGSRTKRQLQRQRESYPLKMQTKLENNFRFIQHLVFSLLLNTRLPSGPVRFFPKNNISWFVGQGVWEEAAPQFTFLMACKPQWCISVKIVQKLEFLKAKNSKFQLIFWLKV